MKIAIAQINPIVGDFEYNTNKIIDFINRSKNFGADLVVFPELSLLGYPPLDFLSRWDFVETSLNYLDKIASEARDIFVLLGLVTLNKNKGKPFYNSAILMKDGKILSSYNKNLLPTYDVFDEARYFEPGQGVGIFNIKDMKIGVTICEDIWTIDELNLCSYSKDPVSELADNQVDLIINIAASPYFAGKINQIKKIISTHTVKTKIPMVYVNQVGANDELIFQGHSMVFNGAGEMILMAKDFEEDLVIWDTKDLDKKHKEIEMDLEDELISALCLGISDYLKKLKFKKVVIGLSGGIDSSVVATLATMALGKQNIIGVAMPGPYNSPESLEDAKELAKNLGIEFHVVPITGLFIESKQTLKDIFSGKKEDVTEENIQSRLRGLILMAISNKFGCLLLNTGNKSELAVGYCTLYGDTNGALSVLGDVKKTWVYRIARRINEKFSYIPERILTKPPSAELRPNQKDEDSLPPYDFLDKVIELYIEEGLEPAKIIEKLGDRDLVLDTISMIKNNEYKRRQTPPVLKVTKRAFGIGWRFPIAHGFRL